MVTILIQFMAYNFEVDRGCTKYNLGRFTFFFETAE